MPKLNAQEKRWQAEDDARTLAHAEQIKKDPERMKGAASAARKMADDAKKQADSMSKVANKAPKPTPKSSTKSSSRKK